MGFCLVCLNLSLSFTTIYHFYCYLFSLILLPFSQSPYSLSWLLFRLSFSLSLFFRLLLKISFFFSFTFFPILNIVIKTYIARFTLAYHFLRLLLFCFSLTYFTHLLPCFLSDFFFSFLIYFVYVIIFPALFHSFLIIFAYFFLSCFLMLSVLISFY